MGFVEAVTTCLSKYVDFTGQASRSEFWWFSLFQVLALLMVALASEIAAGVLYLALSLPMLSVGARRLHDIGRSGFWLLLGPLPVVQLALLAFFLRPSKDD